jgi:hypothetical protein
MRTSLSFNRVGPVLDSLRGMMHDHILERGAALRTLSNAVNAWLIVYHERVAIAGLPGKERRAELEKLTWDAVKKAHEFIRTEDAAKFGIQASWAGLSVRPEKTVRATEA